MAMISQRPRRTREFTGPSPHSVAILARPPNRRPADYLIMERRKKEKFLEDAESQTHYQKLCDMKNDWEKMTDRKIQVNAVKRRVRDYLQAEEFTVEDRRERLRKLLSSEDEQYLREMEAKEETTLERQAKMRERAKFLKEKREAERLELVQEKLDRLFRNQCEELRSTLSKRQQDEVCAERLDQIRMKEEQELERAAEEAMFAKLWYDDIAMKAAREEKEMLEKHERARGSLDVLQKQMAALAQQKADAKALKLEEAALLKEQAMLRKLEEQKHLEEKVRRQEETRNMLDHSLQLKLRKKAREEQEQLAFDMKILQQLLEESRNEAMEQAQRKKELKEEDRRYREYLKKLIVEEKAKEAELDRLVNEEVERMWQKRLDQWALERKARKQLLDQVLQVRQGQIQERLRQNEIRQQEAERERVAINEMIEENKRLDAAERQKRQQQNHLHQSDLESQIAYRRERRAEEAAREEEEYRMGVAAEAELQWKIKEVMDTAEVVRQHPMRKALLQQMHHI